MKTMPNKNGIIAFLVTLAAALLIGGGYFVYTTMRSQEQAQPVRAEASDTTKENTESQSSDTNDAEGYKAYAYILNMLVTSYRVTYGEYPASSAEGWQRFLETSAADFVDPYTGKSPTYTTTAPGVGEVQYITPGTCSLERPELEPTSARNTFAYRANVGGKLVCYSNTSGAVREK